MKFVGFSRFFSNRKKIVAVCETALFNVSVTGGELQGKSLEFPIVIMKHVLLWEKSVFQPELSQ